MKETKNRLSPVLLAALTVVVTPVLAEPAGTNRSHPNVLFIAFDDLNDWVQDLGGHPQTITPNLQRLSQRGIRFTNAHCAAPVCNPSRTAIMTGLRPATTGVYMNRDAWRTLSGKVEWMNLHFRTHGYRVVVGGKIYHGGRYIAEDWDASLEKPRRGLPTPVAAQTSHFELGPLDVDDSKTGDYQVVSWVIGQINQKVDKPRFIACGIYRPHFP